MPTRQIYFLRFLAASLITGSGIAHIASLWFRPLDEQAVAATLLGAVYLIIGIGLFGQSRFTLFLAIGVPGAVTFFAARGIDTVHSPQGASAVTNLLVITLSVIVLWLARRKPGQ